MIDAIVLSSNCFYNYSDWHEIHYTHSIELQDLLGHMYLVSNLDRYPLSNIEDLFAGPGKVLLKTRLES